MRFKMPKKVDEPKEQYLAVVNYMNELVNNNPDLLAKITKKETKKLDVAVKNLHKLAALAEKQGLTDPELEDKSIDLLSAFNWSSNCANGSYYWLMIYNILGKIKKSNNI